MPGRIHETELNQNKNGGARATCHLPPLVVVLDLIRAIVSVSSTYRELRTVIPATCMTLGETQIDRSLEKRFDRPRESPELQWYVDSGPKTSRLRSRYVNAKTLTDVRKLKSTSERGRAMCNLGRAIGEWTIKQLLQQQVHHLDHDWNMYHQPLY